MNTKTPILDGAAFRMNPKYSCQQCDWAGSDKAERNQHADTTGHLLVLNASEPITASPAVAAVQPLKPQLDDPKYCQNPDCEWEAGVTLSRGDDTELHLCAQCATAFAMGQREGEAIARKAKA